MKRDEYWKMIRNAHKDYAKNECDGDVFLRGFRHWVEHRWGLAIELIDGKIGSEYNIINESKFLLFKIKYS